MSETRPAIGICAPIVEASWGVWNQAAALLPFTYINAIQRAGGLALMIPPDPAPSRTPTSVLRPVDGLILAGGARHRPRLLRRRAPPRDRRARSPSATTSRSRSPAARSSATCRCWGSAAACSCSTSPSAARCSSTCPRRSATRSTAAPRAASTAPTTTSACTPGSLAAVAAGEQLHATKSHHHQGVDAIGDGLSSPGSRRSTICPRRSRRPSAASCSASSGTPRPTSAAG